MIVITICSVFIIGFFGNSLVDNGIIPPHATLLTELIVYGLFIYSLIFGGKKRGTYAVHLFPYYTFFLISAVCSIIVAQYFSIKPIFSLRLIFRFYLFYLALINLDLETDDLKKITQCLFILFIIQLPASAVMFGIYGISEKVHGTYGGGGGLTTSIPIVGLAYLAGYYFFHRKRKIFILLAVGFILYGIVGKKAALMFLYPLAFLGIYVLMVIREKGFDIVRDGAMLLILSIVSLSVMGATIKVSTRLNPEKVHGGSVDYLYAFKQAKEYTTHKNPANEQYGGGRYATSKIAFETLVDGGFANVVFGFGPGALTQSVFEKQYDSKLQRIRKSYGLTGMAYIALEYGLIGLLCISLIFLLLINLAWRWFNVELEPYWKAFAAGTVIFSILQFFIFLFYNMTPIADDTIMPPYYFSMALAFIRLNELSENT